MKGSIGKCNWSAIDSSNASLECLWDFSPSDQKDTDELIITGIAGSSVRMGGMGAGLPINIYDNEGKLVKTIEFENPEHSAQSLIQSVVNEMRGVKDTSDGDLIRSPARADNAIRTSEVLDTILNNYYGGRHDEFWKREDSWPGLET